VRRIAAERDQKVIDARQAEAEAAVALAAPSDDIVGGDAFDSGLVDLPESRDE
jgi:DNA-directed RNA polymerase subunit beta'